MGATVGRGEYKYQVIEGWSRVASDRTAPLPGESTASEARADAGA